MQDIYKLVIDGFPYSEIMERLQISERTFYRYLEVIFAGDRRSLAENIDDTEFLNQMAIARDRLLQQRRDLLEMAHDPEVDAQVRINANHLIAEISAAVFRIYTSGPALLARRHQFPRNSLTGPGGTGLKLVLKKDNEENENGNNEDNDDDNGNNDKEEQKNPLAFNENTYNKILKNKKQIEEAEMKNVGIRAGAGEEEEKNE